MAYKNLFWMIPVALIIAIVLISMVGSVFDIDSLRLFNIEKADIGTMFTQFLFYYLIIFGILSLLIFYFSKYCPIRINYMWIRFIISAIVAIIIVGHTFVSLCFVRVYKHNGLLFPLGYIDDAIEAPVLKSRQIREYVWRGVSFPAAIYMSFVSNKTKDAIVIRNYCKIFINNNFDPDSWYYNDLLNTELKDEEASLILARALKSLDAKRRSDAISLLEQWESKHPDVFNSLFEAASSDPDQYVRQKAAYVLTVINFKDPRLEAFALDKINNADPIGTIFLFSLSETDPRIPLAFIRFLKDKRTEVSKAWWDAALWSEYDFKILESCGDEVFISRLMKDPIYGDKLRSIVEKRPLPAVRSTLRGPSVFIQVK
jgi:hypothetical protein